jgi:hypothetical protein
VLNSEVRFKKIVLIILLMAIMVVSKELLAAVYQTVFHTFKELFFSKKILMACTIVALIAGVFSSFRSNEEYCSEQESKNPQVAIKLFTFMWSMFYLIGMASSVIALILIAVFIINGAGSGIILFPAVIIGASGFVLSLIFRMLQAIFT